MGFLGRRKGWISAQAHVRSTNWTRGKQQYLGRGPETSRTRETTAEVTVKPEGAPEFEATVLTDRPGLRGGGETYVVYDPENPNRCEIDFDRLQREFKHQGGRGLAAFPGWRVDDIRAAEAAARGAVVPPPAVAASVTRDQDLPAQLATLSELHDSGTLTDAEFAAAKERMLRPQA
jgi:hypothetical protein